MSWASTRLVQATFSRRNILQMLVTRFHTNWLPKKITSKDPFPIPITFHVSSSIVSTQTFSFCRASSPPESDSSGSDVIETFTALKFFVFVPLWNKSGDSMACWCIDSTLCFHDLQLPSTESSVSLYRCSEFAAPLSHFAGAFPYQSSERQLFFSSRLLLTASGDGLTFLAFKAVCFSFFFYLRESSDEPRELISSI